MTTAEWDRKWNCLHLETVLSVCEHISLYSGLYSQFEWGQALFPKCWINSKKGQADHFASHFPCTTKISHYCSTVLEETGELPGSQVQVAPCKGSASDTLSPPQRTRLQLGQDGWSLTRVQSHTKTSKGRLGRRKPQLIWGEAGEDRCPAQRTISGFWRTQST